MIKRYDFSDPQATKDVCYRRTAAWKAHMRRYINEGKIIYCLSVWASTTKKNIALLKVKKVLQQGLPPGQENLTTSPPH